MDTSFHNDPTKCPLRTGDNISYSGQTWQVEDADLACGTSGRTRLDFTRANSKLRPRPAKLFPKPVNEATMTTEKRASLTADAAKCKLFDPEATNSYIQYEWGCGATMQYRCRVKQLCAALDPALAHAPASNPTVALA